MNWLQKLIIPFLLAAGILTNFFREIFLAYIYGISDAIDIFRITTFIPLVFFQTMGTVIVGLYLPFYKPNYDREYNFLDSGNITKISFFVFFIGILTSPFLTIFTPSVYTKNIENTIFWSSMWSWFGFLIVSITFHYRIRAQSTGNTILIAGTSLIFSVSFIIAMFFLNWFNVYTISSPYSLIISFCFACFILLVFYSNFFNATPSIFSILKAGLHKQSNEKVTNHLIIGVFFIQFLLLIPRFMDRGIAASAGVGGIATLEYAYNIYTAAGMIIGTSATIIYAQQLAGIFSMNKPLKVLISIVAPLTFLSLLATIFTYHHSSSLVLNVYYRGAFTLTDVQNTSKYLEFLMISFAPMVMNMILFQILLGSQKLIFITIPTIAKIISKYLLLLILKNTPSESAIGISSAISEIIFFMTGTLLIYLHAKNKEKQKNI